MAVEISWPGRAPGRGSPRRSRSAASSPPRGSGAARTTRQPSHSRPRTGVGLVEATLHEGQRRPATGLGQLPARHAGRPPVDGHPSTRLQVDDLGRVTGLEAAHGVPAADPGLDADRVAEPGARLLGVGQRLPHLVGGGGDDQLTAQVGGGEVGAGQQWLPLHVGGQVGDGQRPERLEHTPNAGAAHRLGEVEVALGQRQHGAVGALGGQLELGGGLHPVEQPAEAQRVVVGVQQPLVRGVALGRVAAPELVPLGQLDLGVLGQPETQLGRVGQGLADAPDGRGETGLDLHRLTHCRSLSDSRRRPA